MTLKNCTAKLADQEGVPRRGWILVEEIDTGLSRRLFRRHGPEYACCDYCGHTRVRYLFVLRHPQWPEQIRVGGDCASHLTGRGELKTRGPDNARKQARLEGFLHSQRWKRSQKGNLYIAYDKHRIVIYRNPDDKSKYKVQIDDRFGGMSYASEEQAMRRAFEKIDRMK